MRRQRRQSGQSGLQSACSGGSLGSLGARQLPQLQLQYCSGGGGGMRWEQTGSDSGTGITRYWTGMYAYSIIDSDRY